MEYDIHTVLDSATLATTLWVIYMIRFKLNVTHDEDLDNFPIYYVVSLPADISLFFFDFSLSKTSSNCIFIMVVTCLDPENLFVIWLLLLCSLT
jgi:hypothetical protein